MVGEALASDTTFFRFCTPLANTLIVSGITWVAPAYHRSCFRCCETTRRRAHVSRMVCFAREAVERRKVARGGSLEARAIWVVVVVVVVIVIVIVE